MKDMGQSASRDALVSNSEQGENTPGPWRVEQDTTLIWGNCDPEDRSTYGMGYPVAEAKIMWGHGSPFCRSARHDEAEANARLIAAAPDMYVALDACRVALMNRDQDEREAKLLNAIKLVLAKARGQS